MSEQSTPRQSLIEISLNRFSLSSYTKCRMYEQFAVPGFDESLLCVTNSITPLEELQGGVKSDLYQYMLKKDIIMPDQSVLVLVINKAALIVVCEIFGPSIKVDLLGEHTQRAYNEMIKFYSKVGAETRLSNCIICDPNPTKKSASNPVNFIYTDEVYLINSIRSAATLDEMSYSAVTLSYYHKCIETSTDGKYVDDIMMDINIYQNARQLIRYSSKSKSSISANISRLHVDRDYYLNKLLSNPITKRIIYRKGNTTQEDLDRMKSVDGSNIDSFISDLNIQLSQIEISVNHPDTEGIAHLYIDAYTGEVRSNVKSHTEYDLAAMTYCSSSADNREGIPPTNKDSIPPNHLPRLDFNQVIYKRDSESRCLSSADDLVATLAMSPRKLSDATLSHSNLFCLVEDTPQMEYNISVTADLSGDEIPSNVRVEYLENPLLNMSKINEMNMIIPECLAFVCSDINNKSDIAISITEDVPATREFLLDCFRKQYLLRSTYSRPTLSVVLVINIIISKSASSRPKVQFTVIHTMTQRKSIYFTEVYINQMVRAALLGSCFTKAIYMFDNKSKTHYLPKFIVSKTIELFLNRLAVIAEYIKVFDKFSDFYITNIATELQFIYLEYYIPPPATTMTPSTSDNQTGRVASTYVNHILHHYELINSALRLTNDVYVVANDSKSNDILFNRVNNILLNYNLIQMYSLNKVQYSTFDIPTTAAPTPFDSTLSASFTAAGVIALELANKESAATIVLNNYIPVEEFIHMPGTNTYKKFLARLSEGEDSYTKFTTIGHSTLLSLISTHYLKLNDIKDDTAETSKKFASKKSKSKKVKVSKK
jgi:hypothetical protein